MNTADPTYLRNAIEQLKTKGIHFEAGLTDGEVARAESRYSITFPPDLRAFLQLGLPVHIERGHGDEFYNWRSEKTEDIAHIEKMLYWPTDMLLFDVEHNNWWHDTWDKRPERLEDAKKALIENLSKEPKLIPIYAHRFMPEEPNMMGNPVFSMHGLDTIHYGYDLAHYLHNEFYIDRPNGSGYKPREIPFWYSLDQVGFNVHTGFMLVFRATLLPQLFAITPLAIDTYGTGAIPLSILELSENLLNQLMVFHEQVKQSYDANQHKLRGDGEQWRQFYQNVGQVCQEINLFMGGKYWIRTEAPYYNMHQTPISQYDYTRH